MMIARAYQELPRAMPTTSLRPQSIRQEEPTRSRADAATDRGLIPAVDGMDASLPVAPVVGQVDPQGTVKFDPIMPPRRAGLVSRMAWNFCSMGAAEVACRATSVLVTLALARELGKEGYGRIEFAFNVVFWLVLLVRSGSEVIAARELARHPRLIRPLVNQILGIKIVAAVILYLGLAMVAWLGMTDPIGRALFLLYGLMLVTTALGIDFVYRGVERMGLLAVSLYLRTVVYAVGVSAWVNGLGDIVDIPVWLALGEGLGIALVWLRYVREYGLPRPTLSGRFLQVFTRRCRPVVVVQFAQTVLGSVDLMVVGLLRPWEDVGLYGAPHRMIAAALTFGMIFQQVVFPMLARSWRSSPLEARRALDALVRVLAIGMIPLAVGTTILAEPLVAAILPRSYAGGGWLLALGIWRAPLLTLVFLYHTALIATNRESSGVWLLGAGAIGSGPLIAFLLARFGLPGATFGLGVIALVLVIAGYACLARVGRQPIWHHHILRPVVASLVMIPVCWILTSTHLLVSIGGGAIAYGLTLLAIGGLRRADLLALLGTSQAEVQPSTRLADSNLIG